MMYSCDNEDVRVMSYMANILLSPHKIVKLLVEVGTHFHAQTSEDRSLIRSAINSINLSLFSSFHFHWAVIKALNGDFYKGPAMDADQLIDNEPL